MSDRRRIALEITFRFVFKEALKGEEGKRWLRALRDGQMEVIEKLITEELKLGDFLKEEDLNTAAQACMPVFALSETRDRLGCVIDAWEAVSPLAKEIFEDPDRCPTWPCRLLLEDMPPE